MDSLKPSSTPSSKPNKFTKTIHKVLHFKSSTKNSLSNNGFCLLINPHNQPNNNKINRHSSDGNKEAFVAKLFAAISAVKAAYAELQAAQFPYNYNAIQTADEAVVQELKTISELKQSYLKKQIDSTPPHLTILLAEIQEQQSMMKMYELTLKKLQLETENKDGEISSLNNELSEIVSNNRFLEKKLNSSGQFSVLDGINLPNSNPNDFGIVLHYAVRSVRSFVKQMVKDMESANWDIDAAVKSIVATGVHFQKPNHRCFAFESFVCREMLDGFNSICFSLLNDDGGGRQWRENCCDQFRRLKSGNPIQYLKQNPKSFFAKFTRAKYLRLVHPKMETSFSGNLNQRKMINSGEYPETSFFTAFAEMARRIWLLHCFSFALNQEVSIFQVKKETKYSEIYMESVTDEVFTAGDDGGSVFRVGFMVVPGFKVGMTVIQSQVYVSRTASSIK
ncbi:protein GRAVITROPIC IN THE LIGHT 1-like [Impatiens glandulifera]|uniref:protein GRAVITROPIC IN THE LIGHT 1-like n=1 Tax=Impatiens glandulifera TaxID=253017 RepID=UPI001FB0D123|nr:protein GRAVITROPIC IN THE LIGHT 1-like [Impatiens glandulifera]